MAKTIHIAAISIPAFSHQASIIEFCKKLIHHHNHFHITIIFPTIDSPLQTTLTLLKSLPSNITYTFLPPINKKSLPQNLSPAVQIQLAVSQSMPSFHTTISSLCSSSTTPPLVGLITDPFANESLEVVKEFNLLSYIYFPPSAMTLSLFIHFPKLHQEISCEFRDHNEAIQVPGCVPIHGIDLPEHFQDRSSLAYDLILQRCKRFNLADGFLVNSFLKMEENTMKALVVLVVVEGSESLLSPKGVNYEVAALMSIKNKMNDGLHAMNGWDINSVDPCTWNMVGCSSEGYVISLEMASAGLSGIISSGIGNLSHLRTLLLQNNQLSGPIPAEIGNLLELQTLDLSGNQLVGNIPSSLGSLTHLSYLRLSKNKLSGQIPQLVANLTGLSFLDLSFNNLSGPTPKILAKGYSILGNNFLCTSPSETCMGGSKPVNDTRSSQTVSSHHHVVLSAVIGFSCAFVISVMLLVYWLHWYKSRILYSSYVEQDCEFGIGHLKRFSFRELQVATGNFTSKNIVGQGGFGVVYKGCLANKMLVAVKRLKDPNYTGEVQFQTEVEMIGLAVHRNLLRLYGFCMTPDERLLVYPFMPNGSVADRLRESFRGKPCLDWDRRMRIAVGAARGLLYLHEQCNPKIIHRDVKAANILLDESFEAVVGDFGLAKLLDQRDSHVTTAVRGTVGHIAPEYLSTGQSSEKTDVFGFGILLLELITGQKALDAGNVQVQKGMILDWARTLFEEKRLEVLVDRDLKGCYDPVELEKAVELSLQCTQSLPSLRPKMSEVLKILEGLIGLSVRPEESQGGGNLYDERTCSFSQNYSDVHEEPSFIIEAIELSGPR